MIGKILIVFGLLILFNAFGMPVAIEYSTTINIHRITERQNALILGGIIFLAGTVMFAASKFKKTEAFTYDNSGYGCKKEDENNIKDRFIFLPPPLAKLINNNFVGVDEGWLFISIRIAVGVVTGYFISRLSVGILINIPFIVNLPILLFKIIVFYIIPLLVILYLLSKKPMLNLFNNVFLLNLVFTMNNIVKEFFLAKYHLSTSYDFPTITRVALFVPIAGLLIVYLYKKNIRTKKVFTAVLD